MKECIKVTGFILVAIGTIGLLLNEFAWDSNSTLTIILAVANLAGLINLAFAHFGMKNNG